MSVTKYPLCWPAGWKRTVNRERARFKRQTHAYKDGQKLWTGSRGLSVSEANERVVKELRAMWVPDYVVSTNLVLTSLGTPRSGQKQPQDPGVAVYWEVKGKAQCIAVDQYDSVEDNLAAIAASLSALRAIERHGGAQIMERAFLGFAALPAPRVDWREVLEMTGRPTRDEITARFRQKAAQLHPDKGGEHGQMAELNAARELAFQEIV